MSKIISLVCFFMILFAPTIAKAEPFGCEALTKYETYEKKKSFEELVNGQGPWFFRTKTDFKSKFELNSAGVERYKRLKEVMDKKGVTLIMALIPTRGVMHPDQAISDSFDHARAKEQYLKVASQIEAQGIPVITAFDGEPLIDKDYFYQKDHHWTPFGAEHMAKNVAAEIKGMKKLYKSLPKIEFTTTQEGEYGQKGTYANFIEKHCDQDIPPQMIPSYKTFKAEAGEDDLFGDTAKPEIVLIGTSNSTHPASHANFDGFLRQYIGADVENKSISGGGGDSALYKLFLSEEFRTQKPKVIVWEVPVYQNLSSGPFFRQLLPTITGSCRGKAIAEQTYTVENTNVSLFEEKLAGGFIGQGHYLELAFKDWKERKLKFNASYDPRGSDTVNIRRVKLYEPDGKFFLEFDQEKSEALKKISLSLPEKYKDELTARLCSY